MVNVKQYIIRDTVSDDIIGTATQYDIADLLRANFVLTEPMNDTQNVEDVINELVDALKSGGYTEDLEASLGISIRVE